jgi:hypothetical protein
VSARNRSNLSIKDECRPDSEAEKCGFRNANCGMNFRLGNGTRAKPDSAKPTSRHACWEGQHRLTTRARRSPRRRQIRPSPIRVNLRGLGLYAAGLIFSNHQPRSRSRPLKLTRMGLRRICFALLLLANGLVMCSGRHNEVAYALPHFNLQCLSI